MTKGLLSGAVGLFLAIVGADPITGALRFTFDSFALSAGIGLIPVIVGVFAFSEVFVRASESSLGSQTVRSEEHTSELQSLMRISFAVFCLKRQHTSHICTPMPS